MRLTDHTHLRTGGFASALMRSEPEDRHKPRQRDYRLSARREACDVCGAEPGEHCWRPSLRGPLPRLLPHVGRAPPMHSVTALTHGYSDTHPPKVRIDGGAD